MAGLCFVTREARLRAFEQHRAGQHYEDIYYLPSPAWLPVMSLGFGAAVADLIWCKSLVYFGEELGHRGPVKYVFAYADAVLALDPSFRTAYRWVATAALYRPTEITMDDGLRAASYLQRAVDRWPDDGELRWDYGSLLRFELAPLEANKDRKRALLERAAPQLEMAARLGAGPPWLALNNASLLNKLGRTDQAIRQLEELRETVQSPDIVRDIDAQLYRLKAATYFEAAQVTEESAERARLASYPYVSADLFLLLGDKPDPTEHDRFVAAGFTLEADDAPMGAD